MMITKLDRLSLAMMGGMLAVTAALYSRLPATMPIHFGFDGRADGFAPTPIAIALGLGMPLFVWAFVRGGERFLPRGFRDRLRASPADAGVMLVVTLLASTYFVMLHVALHPTADSALPLGIALGTFMAATGLVAPKLQRNPWIGVRTTWTLTSDEVWARTHRFAGFTFLAAGAAIVVLTLCGRFSWGIVALLVLALAPVLYSFLLARRLDRG